MTEQDSAAYGRVRAVRDGHVSEDEHAARAPTGAVIGFLMCALSGFLVGLAFGAWMF